MPVKEGSQQRKTEAGFQWPRSIRALGTGQWEEVCSFSGEVSGKLYLRADRQHAGRPVCMFVSCFVVP